MLSALILAAGQGKRMKSALPKVLFPIAGRPIVHYPIRAAVDSGASAVVVVVSPATREPIAEYCRGAFGEKLVRFAVQETPRGTGDAVQAGLSALGDQAGQVLIVSGDTPLIEASDLSPLVQVLADGAGADVAFLTTRLADPSGYGRVLRSAAGDVVEIREHGDLRSDRERGVNEINAGFYLADLGFLRGAVAGLDAGNAQGEYYLTDVVALAAKGRGALAVERGAESLEGINDRQQLAGLEARLFERIADRHRRAGVTVRGDARIDDTVSIGQDAVIDTGVCLRGTTEVAGKANIDVGCVVVDSSIGEAARLKPYTVVEHSQVGPRAELGPFAHLRPGSQIDEDAHIGNFVETKKTRVRRGAKANHLAYLGDGDVGEEANLGAGTIFCNYNGFTKSRTVIGARAFIGSDSQLVAPVEIGAGAYVASGTTVTESVPSDALAVGRARQVNKAGYAPKLRARFEQEREARLVAKKS